MNYLKNNNYAEKPAVLIESEKIAERIKKMGNLIAGRYAGKHTTVVAVSNGAVLFVADLIRNISVPLQLDTISAYSYEGSESSGKISFSSKMKLEISDRHVLLVDDILDTGRTLKRLKNYLKTLNPAGLETCVLLDKPSRRLVDINADYVGFEIADNFVVGYGLDYNEYYRNLPYIGVLNT